jgi:nucleoid-associated protein YgaU
MRGILALGIVVGGIALASLFRRPDSPGQVGGPNPGDPVALRRRAGPPAAESSDGAVLANAPIASFTRFPATRGSTAVVEAEKPDVLPPTLAKSFPTIESPTSARWGVSMDSGMSASPRARDGVRTHKIVNGDTLPILAARYLGSADRANEFFEANRDLLTSPDALPIGVELRVPPREAPVRDAQDPARQSGLVPVAPRKSGQPRAASEAPS